MRFEFATAQRILFGPGVLAEAGGIAEGLGRQPLVVTGGDPRRCQPLLDALRARGLAPSVFPVAGEPTVAAVEAGAEHARAAGADLVLAMGGGSALDAGKAIAALASNPGDPLDYLEVIGRGRPLERRPLPSVAIPTTAGTGSEVTRNAVLTAPGQGVKVSLRSPWMLPAAALVDPLLTLPLPPEVTASTGLDAMTQLIEPYLSAKANPLTDALALEGLRHAVRSLKRAWADGGDAAAREDMALASLLGGLALANAGLGAVHGLAAPLGGLRPVPHGVACAALLPHVLEANLRAAGPDGALHRRFQELARVLTGDPAAGPADGVRWVRQLVADLRIPGLARYGLTAADLETVAERGLVASSMKANPVVLDQATLVQVLAQALGDACVPPR
jgi:alcohol dehydrogenase class IV